MPVALHGSPVWTHVSMTYDKFSHLCIMQGKPEPEDLKVVVQKINSHIKLRFPEDFPFYIILAYKFHL